VFCTNCGARLNQPAPESVIPPEPPTEAPQAAPPAAEMAVCPNCGSGLPQDAVFCLNCGQRAGG